MVKYLSTKFKDHDLLIDIDIIIDSLVIRLLKEGHEYLDHSIAIGADGFNLIIKFETA